VRSDQEARRRRVRGGSRSTLVLDKMIGMLRTLAFLAACSLALAACSSSSDNGGPASDWFNSYAKAMCEGTAPCCAAEGQQNDVSACEQFYGLLGGGGVQQAINNGAHFDQSAADQCLSQLKTWFNDCTASGDGPEVCNRVVNGKTAPGGACSTDFDCALPAQGTVTCLYQTSASHGVCVQTLPAEAGKPCDTSSTTATTLYDCSDDANFYCDVSTGTGTCKKKIAVGQPCGSGECVDTAGCQDDPQSGQLVCTALAPAGSSCTDSSDCVTSAYCKSGQCAAKETDGQACTTDDVCLGFCESSKCSGAAGGAYMCFTNK
jgi:hypothetical protein